jgi:hypothetical protein
LKIIPRVVLRAPRPNDKTVAAGPFSGANDDNDDDLMCLQNFDLNVIESMSEYELLRLERIHRHNAKLVSLGLLAPMTSAASSSADRPNRKKRGAPQDDVERRVQPKRKAKQPTSYRNQES